MALFKNYDSNELKKLSKIADKIIEFSENLKGISDEELKDNTVKFRTRLEKGEGIESFLIEAFAVVRETIFRVLGKKLYKVQIMGGIALHQGRIIEMKTGEGKTLTEIAPAYLNALEGEGVHIITVNDYLAKRDKEEMEPVFIFLNLTVGLVHDGMLSEERKRAYGEDVTYSTNTELGFDYLRDNIALTLDSRVQRKLNFVIIDEVDSILVDEARTPLILAAAGEDNKGLFVFIDKFIKSLNKEDYDLNLLENNITLSEKGIQKAEIALGVKNLSQIENSEINHLLKQGLMANYIFEKDRDYIVQDNEIVLVDSNTGRIAEGRKMTDGLHQAIEAKEDVIITSENKTLASITYQNFFKLYGKLSGMSGTVKTEEYEFRELYSLDVVVIPTNKDIAREDYEDKFYITEEEKIEAIIKDIIDAEKTLRPILVATINVGKSELLSKILKEKNINHQLLNAKTDSEEEANIIALAGEKGKITIATNIAGRGTDIKITEEVNNLGGLKVIGMERSSSRRIDNQLIGRAGRQGNNGSSQFYISSEDEICKKYINEDLEEKLKKQIKDNPKKAIKLIEKINKKAQETIENTNFEIRKETVKYDDVINKHRKLIYEERNRVLNSKDIRINISMIILHQVVKVIDSIFEDVEIENLTELDMINLSEIHNKIQKELFKEVGSEFYCYPNILILDDDEKIINFYAEALINHYNKIAGKYSGNLTEIVQKELLLVIDRNWINHIEEMEALRRETNHQSFMQKDPYTMYKILSGEKFTTLIEKIQKDFINVIFSGLLIELENKKSIILN